MHDLKDAVEPLVGFAFAQDRLAEDVDFDTEAFAFTRLQMALQ